MYRYRRFTETQWIQMNILWIGVGHMKKVLHNNYDTNSVDLSLTLRLFPVLHGCLHVVIN